MKAGKCIFWFLFLIITTVGGCKKQDSFRESITIIQPPTANAGFDLFIRLPLDSITLDGSTSTDAYGSIISIAWKQISGPNQSFIKDPSKISSVVNKLIGGIYFFELKVTNNSGLFAKDTVQVEVKPSITMASCDNRTIVNARLVPFGVLSEGRIGLVSATAGNKILFAGGMGMGAYSSRVDIFDISNNNWSTAELSIPERQGMAVATVGNKILFAGGGDNDDGRVTSRVDIYDASTNTWTTAELSKAREYLASATIGNKVFFAGGGAWEPFLKGSNVVDIYDNSTNTWSTATLSEGRFELSAIVVGTKIFFAGGFQSIYSVSSIIDIYDGSTSSWSKSSLYEPTASMASIAANNKIFWAGGAKTSYNAGYSRSGLVEIRDVTSSISTFTCISPRSNFSAVIKDDNIVFFTGGLGDRNAYRFEIYNLSTGIWSTGVLNHVLTDATIISVNNTIYVAGGRDNVGGPYFNQVWKLEF